MQDRRNSRGLGLVFGIVAALALPAGPAQAASSLADIVAKLGGKDCERAEGYSCVTVKVPYDHNSNDPQQFLEIEFAIDFAEAESKGILFYVVGGPGGSGIDAIGNYLPAYDERLTAEMDIVFFDQRGVGPDYGIDCPKANAVFDTAPLTPQQPKAAIEAARAFVESCMAETPNRDLLPWLDTEQAIRDLEAFRQAIGAPKVWLYGESYGTQFAQQYAAAFPGALDGLILDGVVDLTLDADGYYEGFARAFDGVLRRTLEGCDAIAECRADMGKPATEVYDALIARLTEGPIEVGYPLPSGAFAGRELTRTLVEAVATGWVYGPADRADFLRALAAAGHGNYVPMLRRAYSGLYIDPETLEGQSASDWYGAAYYAITCRDYGDAGQADPEKAAAAIMAKAKALEPEAPRLIRTAYAERIACAFWPQAGTAERPASFTGGGYPTFVLNTNLDPATPITNGYAVFDRIENGYMITQEGGPHVIFGRELACPDQTILAAMLDGTLPAAREQYCDTDPVAYYEPVTLLDAQDRDDPFVIARAIETEMALSPELYYWDGWDPLSVGCDYGGSIDATSTDTAYVYEFRNCAMWPQLMLNGRFTNEDTDAESSYALDATAKIDGKDRGTILYRHDLTTDTRSLGGVFDGKALSTPRPAL